MKTHDEIEDTRRSKNQRREIIKLRRQVKQLRKKVRFSDNDIADEFEDEIEPVEEPKKEKLKFACPKCGKRNTEVFMLGYREYYRCPDCESRGRTKLKA